MDESERLALILAVEDVVTKSDLPTIQFGSLFNNCSHMHQLPSICTVIALKMFYISDADMLVMPGDRLEIHMHDLLNVVNVMRCE